MFGMNNPDLVWLAADADQWERLRRGESVSPTLDAAWARGALGVDPLRPASELVAAPADLAERQARLNQVIELLQVLVYAFGDRLPLDTLRAVLADADGVVLWAGGGEACLGPAMQAAPQVGERWGERDRGPNALGTALAVQGAVVVEGGGHLRPELRELLCCGAPVRCVAGEVVAVLSISRPLGATVERSMSLVRGLVSAVEAMLRRESGPVVGDEARALADALVDLSRLPAAMIDGKGQLLRANLAGVELIRRRLGGEWARGALLAGGAHAEVAALNVEAAGQAFAGSALFGGEWAEVLTRALELPAELEREDLKLRLLPVKGAGGAVVVLAELRRPAPGASMPLVDARVQTARNLAARLANGHAPVLIMGERGSGRAHLARELVRGAGLAQLVELDADGAVWRDLEVALFGAPRGSAVGALQAGAGGAVLLREIGALPAPLQLRLLRWLRENLGAGAESRVPRVIFTGGADLRERARVGSFRADLFEIVSARSLSLPPLAERRDLESLVQELIGELSLEQRREPPTVAAGLIDRLAERAWPGNVMELRATLAQALSHAGDGPIGIAQLSAQAPAHRLRGVDLDLDALTERAMRDALAETGGNVSAAAKRLGVARSTFYRMLERYALR